MSRKRLDLTFPPRQSLKPIIFHLVKDYDLTPNILRAQIEPGQLGRMLLELTGRKKQLLARGEPFRLQPDYDFLQRPIDEPCGYEVSGRHRASFDAWKEEVSAFLGTALTARE